MLIRQAAILALLSAAFAAHAQAPASYQPPRLADGHPNLQGDWTNSSITILERTDPSLPLTLSPDQVKKLEKQRATQLAAGAAQTDPNAGAPPKANDPGGYNAFWLDRGTHVGVVKGEARSSWITEPADGKMPISAEGRKKIAAILAKRSPDNPEGMNPADRCLIGSRGSGGPPMLNNMYNNTYQIVQAPGAVVIDVEMMHDARIIRMGGAPRPDAVKQWLGDSIGHWEGDTLVVVTHGWKRLQGDYEPIYLSEQATVTERFSRIGPSELLYQFTVDDPGFYSRPWTGEETFSPSNGSVYEYACHEGNYALRDILAGARVEDKLGVKHDAAALAGE